MNTLKVELINNGLSVLDVMTIVSLLLSFVSAAFVIHDKIKRIYSKRTNFSITIIEKIPNVGGEIFYCYISFLNSSSLPLTFFDFSINSIQNKNISDTSNKKIGGDAIFLKTQVKEQLSRGSVVINRETYTKEIPFVVAPYDSFGAYIGFYAGKTDSWGLYHKEFYLNISCSRGNFKIPVKSEPAYIKDCSYKITDRGIKLYGKSIIEPRTKMQKVKEKITKLIWHKTR